MIPGESNRDIKIGAALGKQTAMETPALAATRISPSEPNLLCLLSSCSQSDEMGRRGLGVEQRERIQVNGQTSHKNDVEQL